MPLKFKRGYHRHFKAMDGASLAHSVFDADYNFLIAPMEQGYRLLTGAEFAALDAPPSPAQLTRVLPYARQLFPLDEATETTAWMGSRPCFPDSLPVIGAAPRHKGLWFNFGHGHYGFTIGPSTGRLLAETISGVKPFCDPAPYLASRFN
jgi:D-amino-acid dehydrogenase